ncbi:MAG: glycosyltransferase family 2 protein [Bacteroidales bacterium]|nr:glycosyltransferase family 2 protein [Bacteroidales bacterium]
MVENISIIIPIYFNEGSINRTYQILISEVFPKFPNLTFEIIFVDDGSKDGSFEEIQEIQAQNKSIKVIQFSRNFGQVAALYAGYEVAKGEGILNIAADLQEPVNLMIEMIGSFIREEAPIIVGQRIDREENYYRKMTSKFFYVMMRKLSFSNMPDGGFDVALISKEVKDKIMELNESNPFWQGQILWTGFPVKFIPYARQKRDTGKSRWTFSKKIKYLLDGVLNYSYAPLRFFSLIGIISFLLGILYSMIIIIQYIFWGTPFVGWAPLMIIILLFSGMQLLVLGLIGEYLWRTLEQTKNRPKFIIKKKII